MKKGKNGLRRRARSANLRPGRSDATDAIADFLRDDRLRHRAEPASQRVQLALYRRLAEGEPVAVDRLAETVGLPGQEVLEILGAIPPSNYQYDENGRIVGFRGLSQVPSRHRVTLAGPMAAGPTRAGPTLAGPTVAGPTRAGRALYAWCAFDCLFLPALLECPLRVASRCPVTQAAIRLSVTPTGVETIQPECVVMSFVTPEAARLRDDLRGTFCCHVNFFASGQAAETWRAANEGALILSLDEAYDLGRIRNEARFKDALAG